MHERFQHSFYYHEGALGSIFRQGCWPGLGLEGHEIIYNLAVVMEGRVDETPAHLCSFLILPYLRCPTRSFKSVI